jgi:plastocyanin
MGPPLAKPPKGVAKSIIENQFFPKTITVHVGDRVRWTFHGFHTATFPGGAKRIPWTAGLAGQTVSGFADAAGSPFWFNGQPVPGLNAAAARRGARNSGLPLAARPRPYLRRFTRAGTFRYVCLIHPDTMRGTVRVVPRGRPLPRTTIRRQVARAHAEARRVHRGPAHRARNTISAGNGTAGGIDDLRFFPSRTTVRAGTTLTLRVAPGTEEPHTFTFGPPGVLKTLAGGFLGETIDPVGWYPSDPQQPLAVTSTAHGNGFVNTGFLDHDGLTPQPSRATVRFDEPGTYRFVCLVHGPAMSGTITVTG